VVVPLLAVIFLHGVRPIPEEKYSTVRFAFGGEAQL
jgi:hypothetical protein